jgi:hypothetical protein
LIVLRDAATGRQTPRASLMAATTLLEAQAEVDRLLEQLIVLRETEP